MDHSIQHPTCNLAVLTLTYPIYTLLKAAEKPIPGFENYAVAKTFANEVIHRSSGWAIALRCMWDLQLELILFILQLPNNAPPMIYDRLVAVELQDAKMQKPKDLVKSSNKDCFRQSRSLNFQNFKL